MTLTSTATLNPPVGGDTAADYDSMPLAELAEAALSYIVYPPTPEQAILALGKEEFLRRFAEARQSRLEPSIDGVKIIPTQDLAWVFGVDELTINIWSETPASGGEVKAGIARLMTADEHPGQAQDGNGEASTP